MDSYMEVDEGEDLISKPKTFNSLEKKISSDSVKNTRSNKLDELNRRTKYLAEIDKKIAEKELALKKTKNKALLIDKQSKWKVKLFLIKI